MPKVSKFQFKIDGKDQEFDVMYSQTKKFTVKDFPISIINVAQDSEFMSRYRGSALVETEKELEEMYQKMIDRYHEMKKTARKVIVYELECSEALYAHYPADGEETFPKMEYLPGFSKEFLTRLNSTRSHGCASQGDLQLIIEYKVLIAVCSNGKQYHVVKKDGSIGHQTSVGMRFHVIDWTPEREQFFENLRTAMSGLLRRVLEVMGEPENLIKFVESNQKFLG